MTACALEATAMRHGASPRTRRTVRPARSTKIASIGKRMNAV
jgi:hypothetical protein